MDKINIKVSEKEYRILKSIIAIEKIKDLHDAVIDEILKDVLNNDLEKNEINADLLKKYFDEDIISRDSIIYIIKNMLDFDFIVKEVNRKVYLNSNFTMPVEDNIPF